MVNKIVSGKVSSSSNHKSIPGGSQQQYEDLYNSVLLLIHQQNFATTAASTTTRGWQQLPKGALMTTEREPTRSEIEAGLKTIRRRRMFLWVMIAIYLPMIWLALEISQSDKITGIFFGFWLVLVTIAANITAFSRCPSCQNLFHMNGFFPMYFRNCLHCGLHISGDERKNKFK